MKSPEQWLGRQSKRLKMTRMQLFWRYHAMLILSPNRHSFIYPDFQPLEPDGLCLSLKLKSRGEAQLIDVVPVLQGTPAIEPALDYLGDLTGKQMA